MGPVQQQQQQQQQPSEMGEKVVAPASDSDRRRRTSSSSSPHVTIQEPGQPEHEEERLLSGSKSRRDARKSRTSRSADRRSSSTLASSSGGSRRSSAYSSRSVSSDRSSTASTSSTSAKSCAHSTCVLAEPCRRMIERSGLLSTSTKPLMILDNACGGSALATFTMFDALPEAVIDETQIIAMDNSQNAVAAATHRLSESEWSDRVMTLKMDMQNVDGLGQKEFDYVFTNFAINLAWDVDSTLKGLYRTLKPDGIFAFTVWHRLEWVDVLRTAFQSSIAEAPAFPDSETCLLHFSNYHAWHDPSWVRMKLSEQGFTDVEIEVLPTRHRFTKEEFMENFGGCVVSYLTKCAWGTEAAEKYKEKIAFALEKYLSDKGEGEIELELDALVVTAKKGAVEAPRAM